MAREIGVGVGPTTVATIFVDSECSEVSCALVSGSYSVCRAILEWILFIWFDCWFLRFLKLGHTGRSMLFPLPCRLIYFRILSLK